MVNYFQKIPIISLFIVLMLVILFLAFFGCNTNDHASKKGKVFHYNESKGIASLDPAFARNLPAIWAVSQLYNGLLQLDDSLNIIPCIAKNYDISDNSKTYSFKLRTDVYFHDHPLFMNGKGRKVVASDFEFSYSRIVDPANAFPGAWVFNMVDRQFPGTNNGFKTINDSTFQITLKSPFPSFPGILTMPYCFVLPKEIVTYYGKDFRNHPVGTGPFKFKLWIEGEKLILVKNENYFERDSNGARLPKIDAISITFITDKQSEFLEFIKGRLDFISGINAAFKDELVTMNGKQNPKYHERLKMLTCPYLNTEYLGILVDTGLDFIKKNPLRLKKVRQAINLAIDRKKMLTFLRNNIGFPATAGFVPKGIPYFSETKVKGYPYRPDSALKLLAEAGFPYGKGMLPVKLTTSSDYLDLCEYIQNELSIIGIKIDIDVVSGLSFREMLANSKMIFFRGSWVADYPDAENYLALFYSKNFSPTGPNYTHFKSTKFDKLYESSLITKNLQQRIYYDYQMDSILLDEAVIVPLFYDVAIRFTQKNICNLGINPLNRLILKNVEIR